MTGTHGTRSPEDIDGETKDLVELTTGLEIPPISVQSKTYGGYRRLERRSIGALLIRSSEQLPVQYEWDQISLEEINACILGRGKPTKGKKPKDCH